MNLIAHWPTALTQAAKMTAAYPWNGMARPADLAVQDARTLAQEMARRPVSARYVWLNWFFNDIRDDASIDWAAVVRNGEIPWAKLDPIYRTYEAVARECNALGVKGVKFLSNQEWVPPLHPEAVVHMAAYLDSAMRFALGPVLNTGIATWHNSAGGFAGGPNAMGMKAWGWLDIPPRYGAGAPQMYFDTDQGHAWQKFLEGCVCTSRSNPGAVGIFKDPTHPSERGTTLNHYVWAFRILLAAGGKTAVYWADGPDGRPLYQTADGLAMLQTAAKMATKQHNAKNAPSDLRPVARDATEVFIGSELLVSKAQFEAGLPGVAA